MSGRAGRRRPGFGVCGLIGVVLTLAVGASLLAPGAGASSPNGRFVRITATARQVVTVSFRLGWSGTEACARYDNWTTTAHPHVPIRNGAFAGAFTTSTREHIAISGHISADRVTGWVTARFTQPNSLDFIDCSTGRVAFTTTLLRSAAATRALRPSATVHREDLSDV
jgi:hypothetical protein